MSRRIVLLGDPTSHGGAVTAGSPTSTVGDDHRPIARLGDTVSCPMHGSNQIIEGEPSYTVNGIAVALEGHRTECGSELISTSSCSVG